jgi:hypothetical protein
VAFAVKAAQGGGMGGGMGLTVRIVTGASMDQSGAATATGTALTQAITPNYTGSILYGALMGLSGTYTANGSTTFLLNAFDGVRNISMENASATTSGTPVTLGASAGGAARNIGLLEIVPRGLLAEDTADAPVPLVSGGTTVTSAVFAPPRGTLLVAIVTSNGSASSTSVTVSDTSGLGTAGAGLKWAQRVFSNISSGGAAGYSGIFTARMPAPGVFTYFF